jgi:hypothetical protein
VANENPEPQDPPEGDPPKEGESAEDKFWARIDERLDAAIERGVKKHVPKRTANPSGARTAGRMTLPQIIADAIGGPFTSESTRQKTGK